MTTKTINASPELSRRVPVLRFMGFDDDWVNCILGDVTHWSSGGTPSKDNPIYWNGDIPWVSASSMRGNEYYDSAIKISIEGLKNGSRLAPCNSLLILVRGSMLFNKIPIGLAKRDLAFNQDVKCIVPKIGVDVLYLLNWGLLKNSDCDF